MGYMKILGLDGSLVSRPVRKVQKVHRLMLPLKEQQKQQKKDKGQHSASLGR